MEFSYKDVPGFNMKKMEKKAKRFWQDMTEDKIEIRFVTSPLGLILMAAGVASAICIAKCMGRMEKCSCSKKEAKKVVSCDD